MVLKVFTKVPIDQLQIEYKFNRGYMRIYKQQQSAAFLLLIEQFAVWKRITMMMALYQYLQQNPFHNNDSLKLYYYVHTLYHFYSLISKLIVGLSPHIALQIFYEKIACCLEGFSLSYKLFGHTIFEKAGFRFVSMAHNTNFNPVYLGQGNKDLILIEEEDCIYGFINFTGNIDFDELERPINLKKCSVCQIIKLDLANNIFCKHKYCVHCLNIYFQTNQSITCPINGCNAKLIRRLIQIKNQQQKNRPVSAEGKKRQIKQIKEIDNTLFVDPNWPPIFTGSHIPTYVDQQFIQLRKIIEYKCDEKNKTYEEELKNNEFCSCCFSILRNYKQKGKCNKHFICLQCLLNTQQKCLQC